MQRYVNALVVVGGGDDDAGQQDSTFYFTINSANNRTVKRSVAAHCCCCIARDRNCSKQFAKSGKSLCNLCSTDLQWLVRGVPVDREREWLNALHSSLVTCSLSVSIALSVYLFSSVRLLLLLLLHRNHSPSWCGHCNVCVYVLSACRFSVFSAACLLSSPLRKLERCPLQLCPHCLPNERKN